MTSQNNTLRCAASTMYSITGPNMPNGDVNAPIEEACFESDDMVLAPCSCRFAALSRLATSAAFAPILLPHQLEPNVGVGSGAAAALATIDVRRRRLRCALDVGFARRLRKSGGSHDGHHRGGDADILRTAGDCPWCGSARNSSIGSPPFAS